MKRDEHVNDMPDIEIIDLENETVQDTDFGKSDISDDFEGNPDDEYEENISNNSSSTSNTSSPAATISNVSSSNGDASFVLNIFIIVIGILLILLAIAILIKLKR